MDVQNPKPVLVVLSGLSCKKRLDVTTFLKVPIAEVVVTQLALVVIVQVVLGEDPEKGDDMQ